MALRTWVRQKTVKCDHRGEMVALEVQMVLPPEMLPDQPPRILAHRCSQGMSCNSFDRPACQWSGTLPGFDPLA